VSQAPRLRKVLVANRGEIALRIQRACRELGIETVVQCYSEADRDSLPVRRADHAVCIGPARASQSYLRADQVVLAAQALIHQADAIHPGYGFLSENAAFAQRCDDAGLAFVGPSAEVIRRMGDKAVARATAVAAGVPVTPGSSGTLASADAALQRGHAARLPGDPEGRSWRRRARHARGAARGRTARAVSRPHRARPNAPSATAAMYIEKYLERIRHIEIQVLSDGHGNVLDLGERDCSSSAAPEAARRKPLAGARRRDPRAPGRRGHQGRQGRQLLQRRHRRVPLRRDRPRVLLHGDEHAHPGRAPGHRGGHRHRPDEGAAPGRLRPQARLRCAREDPLQVGHAIECRVNAEDPARNFAPSPGRINWINFPGGRGVRVDSAVYAGYSIPPNYDSMVAKLIVHGAATAPRPSPACTAR
jgi:acetyl-CoA carboxylase biotin carboxylase subunit